MDFPVTSPRGQGGYSGNLTVDIISDTKLILADRNFQIQEETEKKRRRKLGATGDLRVSVISYTSTDSRIPSVSSAATTSLEGQGRLDVSWDEGRRIYPGDGTPIQESPILGTLEEGGGEGGPN